MPILEIFRQTLAALWESKLRSFLTMFGILWGITSVILLVGLGIGFGIDQHERLRTIGTDIAICFGGKTAMPSGGYASGRNIQLNIGDAEAIQQDAHLVKTVSPEIRRTVSEVSQWNASSRAVRGVWPQYQNFRSLKVEQGRLMNDDDETNANRVVILGAESFRQLFPGKPAIGQPVMIEGYPYTVIGVLAKKQQNGSYGSGPDNTQLFVPFSAMLRDFPPDFKGTGPDAQAAPVGTVNNIVVQPVSPEKHVAALREVREILAERHHFDPDDLDALWVWDTLEGAQFTDRIFHVMTLFFAAVALLTLLLGGIGVMNIMLVAVSERTREIGVRKALGATARDIRRQFLVESAIITLVSGAAGLVCGVGVCVLIRMLPLPDFVPHPVISATAIIASLVTLGVITVSAGTYPALRAAGMTPIECLRTD
ncbi:FtsX-like permease family protein [Granulicella sp. 5B5]|uniref:ABC transporter permease n=1 Tax=Granulicella sp. 5B5 TaxID=1617967 RepID=UPI0015F719C7|nr:ABC transporter permease [Granulicella sp. 5B5]QMV19826.1 FtsX-like permease family protein [Granulicella sp. 5B5]